MNPSHNDSLLLEILKQSTRRHRSAREIEIIRHHMLSTLDCLHPSLRCEDLDDLCNEVDFIHLTSHSILFLQNDIGHAYYMISKGEVNLYHQTDPEKEKFTRERFGPQVGKPTFASDNSFTNLGRITGQLKVCIV